MEVEKMGKGVNESGIGVFRGWLSPRQIFWISCQIGQIIIVLLFSNNLPYPNGLLIFTAA